MSFGSISSYSITISKVLYDANPATKLKAEKAIKEHADFIRVRTHKMSDYFYETQLYSKTLKEKNVLYSEQYRDRDHIIKLAKMMKENEEKKKKSNSE